MKSKREFMKTHPTHTIKNDLSVGKGYENVSESPIF